MTFSQFYFGMDGTSGPPFPCTGNGHSYYIGRLGGEITEGGIGFNLSSAKAATYLLTSGYWDIGGPGIIPPGKSAYQWGQQQANAFLSAYNTGPNAPYVLGQTLFGDIESGNFGWGVGTKTQGQDIVHGFIQTIANVGFSPGLYANRPDWDNLIGASWTSPTPFVWWLADTYVGITTCVEAQNEFNSLFFGNNIYSRGGYKVMVWQYNGTSGGSVRDLDLSPYNGYLSGRWNPTPA
ncbi:MAG: hypothetical protein ACHQFZ_05240 [Acidimicrobiales bacterium]